MKYPFIQRLVAQGVQVLEVVDSWQLCILVVGNEQVLHPLEMLAEFFTVGFEVNLPNFFGGAVADNSAAGLYHSFLRLEVMLGVHRSIS